MDLPQALCLAEATALLIGKRLRQGLQRTVVAEATHDLKLAADLEAESLAVGLLSRSPFAIFSEESGWFGKAKSDEPVWVVDPLDGSFNYHHGIPGSGVSLALWSGWTPLLGVVYDFDRDDLYSGMVGQGAHLNGQKMSVRTARPQHEAVLATGFPAAANQSPEAVLKVTEKVSQYRKLRWLGSASLSLAHVAAGHMDAYEEQGIRLWDVAGGLALVAAAGGSFTISPQTDYALPLDVWAGVRP